MCNNKECAAYFKHQQAYRRCFEELRKKWKSYGKAAGNIVLSDTSEEERRAIGGILGTSFHEKNIRFSFAKFEQGLQKTRFAPVDMRKVLEAYFGEAMATNQDAQEAAQKKRNDFFDRLIKNFKDSFGSCSPAFLWLQALISEKKYGYQLLNREYVKDRLQAEILAKNVGKAIEKLEYAESGRNNPENTECEEYVGKYYEKHVWIDEDKNEWPLAVFSAEISGNPHYFDRGSAAGQLLMHAICCCEKTELPESAHQWREQLMGVGIVPDNVASIVHAYGLRVRTIEGWHPAYDAFCRLKEPYVITMENLRGITGACAFGDRVYVVENEMVFSYLVDHIENENKTLLCTSGQLRTAALELIPLILKTGAEIYYSGDIDPDGIGIADRLWQKFGDGIHIWRMTPGDYENSLSNEDIGDAAISKIENILHPMLKKTAECVREKRKAGYQENILKALLADMIGTK
ncbi:MAG: TIGR02679 domain-containing protein [Lachnospiraceae bacterium]|nr:TIGR02679 domain-containing protein [Lachnospiraceae bacterium]